jgi:probable F420-dependent oxidoreductase
VKVNASLIADLASVPSRIRAIEALGYDAAFSAEINSDPFFPLLLAAEHSERVGLATAISVAFARNPMTVANVSHDLNQYARGRFRLGLGSQIAPHITKRFSMPWSQPAARMREFVLALRAIWNCWLHGAELDFRGEFYQHTLMTPMFTPANRNFPAPRVMIAAVGPRMTEVAGEVADGLSALCFTTEKYFRDATLPALERGFAQAGRARRLRGQRIDHRGVRHGSRRIRAQPSARAVAARVLRIHAGLRAGVGTARLGRSAAGAEPIVEAGEVAGDGRVDPR